MPTLTAENLAAAYKQLIAVERGWRDLKRAMMPKVESVERYLSNPATDP